MGKRWLWLLSSPRYLTSETLTPNPTAHSSQAMEPWCLQPDLGFFLFSPEKGEGSRGLHRFGKKPTGFWSQREWGTSPSHMFTCGSRGDLTGGCVSRNVPCPYV